MSLKFWIKSLLGKSIKGPRRRQPVRSRPRLEVLEDRALPSVSLTNVPQWVDQGPGPIADNATNDAGLNAWGSSVQVGAVESIAVEPIPASNPSHYIVYAGTVNGGIWRAGFVNPSTGQWTGDITPAMLTVNAVQNPAGATNYVLGGDPTRIDWHNMSDSQPSLAIGSLALDPNDTSGNTLWAGTGTLSSDRGAGGPQVGLLKTTDGGLSWSVLGKDLAGLTIVKVVPTQITDPFPGGQIVLVAGATGVWRSKNGGQSFQQVKTGNATDLIADPNNNQRFYAAIRQSGVFESDDGGLFWTEIDNGTSQMTTAGGIKLAAQFNGTQTTLFAVTADATSNGSLTGTFEGNVKPSGGGIDSNGWKSKGTPPSTWPPGWGNQSNHFAAAADPSANGVFYFATYQSAIVRVDPNGTWTLLDKVATGSPITNTNTTPLANNTITHDDQRYLAFLGSNLLVGNDGGIYGLETPTQAGQSGYLGRWVSLNSNLRDTELYNAQLDPRNAEIFGGAQDNGTPASLEQFTKPCAVAIMSSVPSAGVQNLRTPPSPG
jgi:hypothetical protein